MREMLRCLALGDPVILENGTESGNCVDSRLLEWLLFSAEALREVHPNGIWIHGGVFLKSLTLSRARVDRPVALLHCEFRESVHCHFLEVQHLAFEQSTFCKGLAACYMRVEHGLFMDGIVSHAGVALWGTVIGGPLNLNGAKLSEDEHGVALEASGVTVGGDVSMTRGFEATGEVRFVAAECRHNVGCLGATITNPSGKTLNGNGIRVGKSVFLSEGFSAHGKVDLISAQVGGNLLMHDAVIRGADADSVVLDLSNAQIVGFIGMVEHWNGDCACLVRGRVVLRHARCGQFDDSPEVWRGWGRDGCDEKPAVTIDVDGFTYQGLGVHPQSLDLEFRKVWLARGSGADRRSFSPQPYNQLAGVLHDAGHEQRARQVRIARDRELFVEIDRPAADTVWRKVLLGLHWLLVCWLLAYGYSTRRTVAALLGMWIFGAAVFWGGWATGSFKPALPHIYNSWVEQIDQVTGEPVIAMDDPLRRRTYVQRYRGSYKDLASSQLTEYPGFMSLIYSADTLLPIVNLHQEPYWEPTGWTRVYLWVHIVGGWLFTTLAVVGFTGIVRRD
ncbi:MAG: hypothetical protein HND58_05700 [Planctomycetota bacterium]|nr:MAG: hypothetical protein HND58_05700 [Planctomycetota bacterium]